MTEKQSKYSRRTLFKIAGTVGASTLLGKTPVVQATQKVKPAKSGTLKVPTRPFGRSGRQVAILSLGGMFDLAANQLMLKQAVHWGVTYWDTADCYQHGSETGIGKYFNRYPHDREKIFLVTKSDARDPEGISRLLERSLQRMNTTYIDLYFIHGIRSIDEIDDKTRKWAEGAKAAGKIRLFGFSTHKNMEQCLLAAAKLDWIDGIMMTYNFRNMHKTKMKEAVAACVEAGIGLTAMKTQAGSSWFKPSTLYRQGNEVTEHFMQKGYTKEQAKLKAVWEDAHIASICSQMDSMRILKANVTAASDGVRLSRADKACLQRFAAQTADQYCAGCTQICEQAISGQVPVGDIMRYHMYCCTYGHADWARSHLNSLSQDTLQRMAHIDFSTAERRCPQKMPIGRLMAEALDLVKG